MSWFEFQEPEVDSVDLFDLKPEKGLIFSNIKTEEEFEFIFLDLKDKEEDGKSDTT